MFKVEVYSRGIFKKVNPCLDIEGRRRIQIGTRYYVALQINEGMVSDGMWTTLTHAALFATKDAADKLAARVLETVRRSARGEVSPGTFFGLDLRHWSWSPGPTQAFTALQAAPTAKEYEVG